MSQWYLVEPAAFDHDIYQRCQSFGKRNQSFTSFLKFVCSFPGGISSSDIHTFPLDVNTADTTSRAPMQDSVVLLSSVLCVLRSCVWRSSTVYFSHGYNRSLLLKEQFKELLRRSKITLKLKVMKVRKKSRSGRRKAEGFVYSSTSKWTHQMSPSWGWVYSVWPAVMRNPKHM